MIRFFITLICLAGFLWLSYYSLHRKPLEGHVQLHKPLTLEIRQAAALMALYHITDAELRRPINLFGE